MSPPPRTAAASCSLSSSSGSGAARPAGAAGLLGLALVLVAAPGCIAVESPPAYAGREALGVEQVEATPFVMISDAPRSLESSAGRLAIEPLDFDQDSLFSPVYSRAVRLTVAGPSGADVLCVHEPEGTPYPAHFEHAAGGAFACLGVVDSARFTLAVERRCYRGVMTFGDGEQYTLTRGRVTIAGIERPTGEVSVHDARGALVAAFDIVPSMTFRVWSGDRRLRGAPRAGLIVAGAALHDWSTYASATRLDPCR